MQANFDDMEKACDEIVDGYSKTMDQMHAKHKQEIKKLKGEA